VRQLSKIDGIKMSFRELLETAQSIALSEKLHPTEVSIWYKYCREFSTRFHTSLIEVLTLDPEFVVHQVTSDQLSTWNTEERIDDVLDLIGNLSNPNYDQEKEKALREEMRQIVEEEKRRVEMGEAIHSSLDTSKKFGDKPKEDTGEKELPKSGGINMSLIKQLQNEEKEGGEF